MVYLEKINNFNENNLLSLDEIVMWALELFQNEKINKLDISGFKKLLIVGSWNAIVTAKIIFSWIDALFCDETNFDKYIEKDIDWLIIASASWEKHAVEFAKKATKKWIKTKLLTCNPHSWAGNILWKDNYFYFCYLWQLWLSMHKIIKKNFRKLCSTTKRVHMF